MIRGHLLLLISVVLGAVPGQALRSLRSSPVVRKPRPSACARTAPRAEPASLEATSRVAARSLSLPLRIRGGGKPSPLQIASHAAIALWSFSSSLAAGRQQMDVLGMFCVAFFGAMLGPTLRDLLVDKRVFWVADGAYLVTCASVAFLTFLVYPWMEYELKLDRVEMGKRAANRNVMQVLVEMPDALGMAFFSVYSAYVALHACPNPTGPITATILGLVSSCFGSFFTDLLCGIKPVLLDAKSHTLYLGPAVLASSTYSAWSYWLGPESANTIGATVSVAMAFLLRMAAVIYNLKLPHWLNTSKWNGWRKRDAVLFGINGEPIDILGTKGVTP